MLQGLQMLYAAATLQSLQAALAQRSGRLALAIGQLVCTANVVKNKLTLAVPVVVAG